MPGGGNVAGFDSILAEVVRQTEAILLLFE